MSAGAWCSKYYSRMRHRGHVTLNLLVKRQSVTVFCLRFLRTNTGPLPVVLCCLYRPSQVSLVLCNSRINIIVKGSKFKESHILENTKLWNKVGRMP